MDFKILDNEDEIFNLFIQILQLFCESEITLKFLKTFKKSILLFL